MATTTDVPPPPAVADARNRAWRTLVQGLAVDLVATLAAVLVVALADIEWTSTYWLGVASLVGKTAITSVVAYVARRVAPPAP